MAAVSDISWRLFCHAGSSQPPGGGGPLSCWADIAKSGGAASRQNLHVMRHPAPAAARSGVPLLQPGQPPVTARTAGVGAPEGRVASQGMGAANQGAMQQLGAPPGRVLGVGAHGAGHMGVGAGVHGPQGQMPASYTGAWADDEEEEGPGGTMQPHAVTGNLPPASTPPGMHGVQAMRYGAGYGGMGTQPQLASHASNPHATRAPTTPPPLTATTNPETAGTMAALSPDSPNPEHVRAALERAREVVGRTSGRSVGVVGEPSGPPAPSPLAPTFSGSSASGMQAATAAVQRHPSATAAPVGATASNQPSAVQLAAATLSSTAAAAAAAGAQEGGGCCAQFLLYNDYVVCVSCCVAQALFAVDCCVF